MKIERLLLIAGILGLLAACADKQPSQTGKAEPQVEPGKPAVMAESGADRRHAAFIRHMHLHAIHLQKLNVALAAGDLEAAATPAYWLSRHQTIAGLPNGWGKYITAMRVEGRAVEEATDIATATAAAERLASNCSGCHEANGVTVDLAKSVDHSR